MIALRARDTLGYDGKAPGDLPRTAAKETRGRAPAYANGCMNSSASPASRAPTAERRLTQHTHLPITKRRPNPRPSRY